MALHFNFSKVRDYQSVTTDPKDDTKWHPVADALVWLSMICGFNQITAKNYEKVYHRIAAYQQVRGSYLRRYNEANELVDVYITYADVQRFIGMDTNASTMTDAQWIKRLGEIAMEGPWDLTNQDKSALAIVGVAKPANAT